MDLIHLEQQPMNIKSSHCNQPTNHHTTNTKQTGMETAKQTNKDSGQRSGLLTDTDMT